MLNSPEPINMAAWRSKTGQHEGLTKTNRYLISINPPHPDLGISEDMTYMCSGGSLPGRSFNTLDYRYYGPTKKLPSQAEYNTLNLQFLLRERMMERLFFDKWMELIQPQTSFDSNWRRNYETSIDIYKYSEYGDATYSMTLEQAFPIVINAIPMQWLDEDVGRFTIEFTYARYSINHVYESEDGIKLDGRTNVDSGAGDQVNRANQDRSRFDPS